MTRGAKPMLMPICRVLLRACVVVFAATLAGCNGNSAELAEFRANNMAAEQREQERLDRQHLAGLEGGLARSLQPSRFAQSGADTLSRLLPGGEEVFSTLSAAVWRDYDNRSSAFPDSGSAYVNSVSSDGEGGFRVAFVVEGRESLAHFPAHRFGRTLFQGGAQDGLTGYTLWSWTDSFAAASGDTEATLRTDGPSYFDYFDINGWQAGTSGTGNFRGFMTYGARTPPANLPTGSAGYEGRLRGEIWNANAAGWGTQTWVRGILRLQANFQDGQVSGRIEELQFEPQGEARYALPDGNVVEITGTSIGEARFEAEWSGNDTNRSAAPHDTILGFSGSLIGEFYGPAADEVGGVLSGRRSATDTSPEQFLAAGFGGSQPGVE